ncbi:uncharacterized protein C7orf57 homolog isoform X2 [Scleropages formosus]|uniref:Uncharacterized protein n=2 Tax=Scleropages formosus TaxID=113540 RepID=A0A8C9SBB7_SCLFO|nr:uncharacterized protein C7orf57-like isoform X2 [Scleropages formosus]XP_018597058.1 uncharacterized protein C7orf57-like isoform X2 [Scleropages formosus]
MSANTNHRRLKQGFHAYKQSAAGANGGPSSQIPGLSPCANDVPEERTRGRRVGIFETDSDYVKLAKQGGQKGLLWHEETSVAPKPSSQYNVPDWFSADSEAEQKTSQSKRSTPDSKTSGDFKKSPCSPLDAPFGSDNKSAWEREADSFASGKEKKSKVNQTAEQMQKLSLTAPDFQEANKFKRKSYDKKQPPVSMSKLLSFGYVEEIEKSPNDDDASSMTSEPASTIALEEDLE